MYPRIKVYDKAKLDLLISMDRNTHSVNLGRWYGYCKRNDQVKAENKGKGIATGSTSEKKKYKSDRQSTKQKRFQALMKVVEDHHAADGYLIDDLKK